MLDSEPDNTAQTQPESTAPAPQRPRRRAASRPAGPPSTTPTPAVEAAASEVGAPETDSPETSTPAKKAAAKKAPAKKAAAKKTTAKKAPAKKTTAKETPAEPDVEQQPTPTEAAPIEAAPIEAAPTEAAPTEAATTDAEVTAPAAKKTAAKRTRTRKAPAEAATATDAEAAAEAVAETETAAPAEPAKTTARKRTTKKTTAPQPEQAAETPSETSTESTAETSGDPIAAALESAFASARDDSGSDRADDDHRDHDQADSNQDDSNQADDNQGDGHQGEDQSGEGGSRRRRRRRGGRRRRRGGNRDGDDNGSTEGDSADGDGATDSSGGGNAQQPADQASSAEGKASETDKSAESDKAAETDKSGDSGQSGSDDSEGGEGRRRRRRRRRRRGEDTAGSPDDPSDVVVRVREPRRNGSDEVTGISGSTRMEAKKQRRREGREAGRRRAPIISEAEFLARRESVNRKMVIRQRDDLSQIAVLEDGVLVEHYVDRESSTSLIGNVYLGRVQNVLPSMEAAFIDIGRGRNAVLYAGELDWDSFGVGGGDRKVEKVLKSGQTVLVQVTKDPVGAKGARLTNHVSIPGRYVVYAPGGHLSGISRKLPDTERKRLKDILDEAVGETASVIVRTAAEGASQDELTRDVNRLKAQWEDIEKKVKSGSAPQLLYAEPDLTLRIVRDLFTEDFSELIIQGNGSMGDAYDSIQAYVQHVAPHLADRMKQWNTDSDGDLFGSYRLDEQIAKGLERKVFLPSGGSLIIDRTEAMTVIDVNTGKFTGNGGNLEATITSNNLEAAEEIVRQLRLRDIGGIIVIDFIDMVLPSNRELLLRRLVECLGRDRTRHQVTEVTSLGLVQMTRKRIGTGLLEAFSTECPHCHGSGVELHDMPVAEQKQADGGARDDHGNRRRRGGKGKKSDGGGKNGGRSDKGSGIN